MERERLGQRRHALGSDRWMVWAPDKTEPERQTIGQCLPTIQQMDFAIRLGRALNRHVNEGGTWLVAWTNPQPDGVPTRLAMGWIDRDGDMPFTIDTEESMQVLILAGIEPYVAQAHQALTEYREHIKSVEIAPTQMIRQRKGEGPRDPNQIVPGDFG